MRLDRITIKDSKQIDLYDIEMVATENAGRVCLNMSDHYGLAATFIKSEYGFTSIDNDYKKEFSKIPKDVTGFRSISTIKLYRYMLLLVLLLVIFYPIWKVIRIFV